MTRTRIRQDARCEDPTDPRWRRIFEPPPAPEVPELDRRFEDFGVPEAIARLSPVGKALARLELTRRLAAKKGQP